VREYCLHSTHEFLSNLDTEDRSFFLNEFKDSSGKWSKVSNTWVSFLRDHVLVPSGCDAVADAICNDMFEFAENDDAVLDLLKEFDDCVDAESISSDEEDEDAPADRNAVVNAIYRTITSDDGNKTVLVELENGMQEISLAEFAKIVMDFKLTPPNTLGNEGKWVWRKTISGSDYEKTEGENKYKISFA